MRPVHRIEVIDGAGMHYSALLDDNAIQIGTGPQNQVRLATNSGLAPLHLLIRTIENGNVAIFNVSNAELLHFPDSVPDVTVIKPNGYAILAHLDRVHFNGCTLVYHDVHQDGRLRLELTFEGEPILHPNRSLAGQVQIEYVSDKPDGPTTQDAVQFRLELMEPDGLRETYFNAPVRSTVIFPNTDYKDVKEFSITHPRDHTLQQGLHRFRFQVSAVSRPELNAVIGKEVMVAPYYQHTLTTQPYRSTL